MLGSSEPRIRCLPTDIESTSGDDAIGLAKVAGLDLDPWQQTVMRESLSERHDGKWSAFEVGLITPRQNGKNSILEVRELAGLYLFGEELILHSAHEFNTADEQFLRIKYLIGQSPDLTYRVRRMLNGHGSQSIELLPTETIIFEAGAKFVKYGKSPRLKFVARTGGSGRGFTGDCIILDEAYRLPHRVISALMPTLSARDNPQVWYTSSAVNQVEHEHGEVLTQVRDRGIKKTSPRLYYVEWSADEERYKTLVTQAKRDGNTWRAAAADRQLWAQSNPGLGYRVSEDAIEAELHAMAEENFKVERLAIGDWPSLDGANTGPIDMDKWHQLIDSASVRDGECAIGIDVAPHRDSAAIGLYSMGNTGFGHMQLINYNRGTGWIIDRLKELRDLLHPLAWAVGTGTYASLETALQQNGFTRPETIDEFSHGDVLVLGGSTMAAACGQMIDAVADGTMRIKPDPDSPEVLESAVAGAQLREGHDSVAWSRKGKADITPLVAVTCARFAFVSRVDDLHEDDGFFGSWR